ncbi:MAG: DUF3147 family protein [Acidobacteriales bacterium]|nr:DUF3147 family protein [Terriglobales bacterium]
MKDLLIRFLVGGLTVSTFATLGDLFKPKSFAGLFGAAPAVALATLALTAHTNGVAYTSIEARSMIAGAIGFFLYASFVSWFLMRFHRKVLWVALGAFPIWLAVTFSVWQVWLVNGR